MLVMLEMSAAHEEQFAEALRLFSDAEALAATEANLTTFLVDTVHLQLYATHTLFRRRHPD